MAWPAAPPPPPIINPPQPQSDGTVLLAGSAPPESVVVIYYSTNPAASYWARDLTLVAPDSGRWSVARPGTVGGNARFYKAEIQ